MKWTEEELKFLFDNYLDKTPLELSTIFKRTVRSIEIKINRSGRSLNDSKWEILTCQNCSTLFKVLKSREAKFCSSSCAAIVSNKNRDYKYVCSEEHKELMRKLLTKPRPLCKTCGKRCNKLTNKYCSKRCVALDPDYKLGHSERMKQRFIDFPELHPNRLCAGIKESYPEKFLTDYLIENNLEEDIHFKKQYKIGTYYVDFYFPKTNVVIEVDGERWHNPDCPKEIKRENTIKEKYILHRFRAKPLLNKEYTETIDEIIKSAKH